MAAMRTLLLSMPFGALDRPALGISLLKAGLEARGLPCDLAYPLELLVRRIGVDAYRFVADELPYTCFAGDWCFALPLYGRRPAADRAYIRDELAGTWRRSAEDVRRILAVREVTPAFLDDCVAAFDWQRYGIVGFTSTFVQNLASLALAGRLKSAFPHLRIVFGGANWEDRMGEALFEAFPFVDHVCCGEADESFPALVAALSRNRSPTGISGVLSRGATPLPAVPVEAVDALPIPDFTDFFAMHARTAPQLSPMLLMETSRGCWWGAKHHCTFCGLNGRGMAFRAKSPGRALAEFDTLTERYRPELVSMVDNILDMGYFRSFLPALANRTGGPLIFFETKANLARAQVALLARAGVATIQPGIESLSDRLLKLMRKGTTGLRNIQLLKWCRDYGVAAEWNILYGFPGETDADYHEMLDRLPMLQHLQPPSGCGPVRVDRFSPYFQTPETFGLKGLRPLPVFRHLYPFGNDRLFDIACYFEADYSASRASAPVIASLNGAIDRWRAARGNLVACDTGSALEIVDTRGGRHVRHRLEGHDRTVYLIADEIVSLAGIVARLRRIGAGSFDPADVRDLLDRLVAAELVVEQDGIFLALAVYERFPLEWETAGTSFGLAAE
jgi:ribosomal peptide maturation radical SAM protein 1